MSSPVEPEICEFLAQALLYPQDDFLVQMQVRLAALGVVPAWAEQMIVNLARQDVEELQTEHVRLFINARDGASCLPYESVYDEGQMMGKAAEELRTLYADWGLEETGEMLDHAAVELAFAAHVARLCRSTDAAWRRAGMEQELEAFARKHLRSWLPDLAADLATAARVPFYQDLAVALRQVFGAGSGRPGRGPATDGEGAGSVARPGDGIA